MVGRVCTRMSVEPSSYDIDDRYPFSPPPTPTVRSSLFLAQMNSSRAHREPVLARSGVVPLKYINFISETTCHMSARASSSKSPTLSQHYQPLSHSCAPTTRPVNEFNALPLQRHSVSWAVLGLWPVDPTRWSAVIGDKDGQTKTSI